MAFRGGRGGGRFGGRFGGGRFGRQGTETAVELFPEIEGLETVKFSLPEVKKDIKFVTMAENLQNFFETSPYYYEDRSQSLTKVEKLDIERYSDKKSRASLVKPPLWHFIKMDKDYMPGELARGERHVAKKVRWDNELNLNKLDVFEKLEKKLEGHGAEKKENEEEDEEDIEGEEDDGEFSDEGDYEQAEYFDDDEDDFNVADDNDDEADY